jgi:hypothetical protein
MPWALERPDPALATGIGIRGDTHDGLARDATRLRARLLAAGLSAAAQVSTTTGTLRARIRPELAAGWAPGHHTTALRSPAPAPDSTARSWSRCCSHPSGSTSRAWTSSTRRCGSAATP